MSRCICFGLGLILASLGCSDTGDDGGTPPGVDDSPASGEPPAPSPDPGPDPAPVEDPSGEAVARGGISLHIEPVGDCHVGDTWLDFPEVAGGHPVTATAHDSLLDDSTGNTGRWDVGCSWFELSPETRFTVGIRYNGDGDQQLLRLVPKVDDSGLQPGTLSIITSDFMPTLSATRDQPCEYETIEVDLPAGRVWGSVQCEFLANEESGDQCRVSEGYFYFENCVPFVPD